MATLRRSPYTVINIWCPYGNIASYTVINIWCPYGNIAKIVLYRYKYLNMATLRWLSYTVINIWCPYGNIAKIALCRYKYLMSIWLRCEDRLLPLYIFDVHMATLRTLSYTVINIWCPYGNIAKIALCSYKYLMSIWLHCEDRLIPL